jgi:hypothetical protein
VCELYCDCRIDTVDEKRRAPMQDEYRDGCTENESQNEAIKAKTTKFNSLRVSRLYGSGILHSDLDMVPREM